MFKVAYHGVVGVFVLTNQLYSVLLYEEEKHQVTLWCVKIVHCLFISTNAVTVLILCSGRRAKRYQRAQLAQCHQVTVTAMAWSAQLVFQSHIMGPGTVLQNGFDYVFCQGAVHDNRNCENSVSE